MERTKLNFWVDILMLIIFIIVAITGVILFANLDIGNRREIVTYHNYLGLFLIALIAIHFLLHFNWIACMIRKKK